MTGLVKGMLLAGTFAFSVNELTREDEVTFQSEKFFKIEKHKHKKMNDTATKYRFINIFSYSVDCLFTL